MAVSYKAPVKDVIFAFDVLDSYNILQKIERFSDFSPEIAVPAIEECAKFAEEVLAPINSIGDTYGATFKDGKVIMPPGFLEAYDKFKKAGWAAMSLPYEIGGGGMPYTLSGGTLEILCAANMSFVLGPGLSIGGISGINFCSRSFFSASLMSGSAKSRSIDLKLLAKFLKSLNPFMLPPNLI